VQPPEPSAQPAPAPSTPTVIPPQFSAPPTPPSAQPVVTMPGANPVVGKMAPAAAAPEKKLNTKLIGGIIALVVIIILAGGAFLFVKNKSSGSGQSLSVNVPNSWKTVKTGLGFTVKAPSLWSSGSSSSSSFDGVNEKLVQVGESDATISSSTTAAQTELDNYIIASTQSLSSNNTEANFDKAVTTISQSEKQTLKLFGADPSKLKTTSSNIKINGTPWLKVTSTIPGQVSYNLYYWDNNHAIALLVVSTTKSAAQNLYNTYSLPMAASVKL
jgi:hypothetical protein